VTLRAQAIQRAVSLERLEGQRGPIFEGIEAGVDAALVEYEAWLADQATTTRAAQALHAQHGIEAPAWDWLTDEAQDEYRAAARAALGAIANDPRS
jgi:hypothetical protein